LSGGKNLQFKNYLTVRPKHKEVANEERQFGSFSKLFKILAEFSGLEFLVFFV
jgi:hypothetical protein